MAISRSNLFKFEGPIIIAHRGASAYAPENTISAFKLAVKQGADAVELDAQLTSDDHVVVFHDHNVERTTDGTGSINNFSLAELKELNAGYSYDQLFNNEKIPLLSEVLDIVGGEIFINIEMKNYNNPLNNLPDKVIELVIDHNLQNNVLLSSFNPIAVSRAASIQNDIPLGITSSNWWGNIWTFWPFHRIIPYHSFHPLVNDVNAELIQKVHKNGKKFYPYTVNDPQQIEQMIKFGVDGIFTDDPLLAVRIYESFRLRVDRPDKI